MQQWYYADHHQQRQGPVSGQTLVSYFHSGQINQDTLLWRDGLQNWQPLRSLAAELGLSVPPPIPAPPPIPGSAPPLPPSGQASFPQSTSPATSLPVTSIYAGFWKRLCAYLIDWLILSVIWIPNAIVQAIAVNATNVGNNKFNGLAIVASLFSTGLTCLYFSLFHASRWQATPGKLALKIRVVNLNGGRISFGRALGRYFAMVLNSLTFSIGFMMAGWTKRKQGLHDMIGGTLVVNKGALPHPPGTSSTDLS